MINKVTVLIPIVVLNKISKKSTDIEWSPS